MHPHVTDCHLSFYIHVLYFLAGTAADAPSNIPNSPPEGEKGTE